MGKFPLLTKSKSPTNRSIGLPVLLRVCAFKSEQLSNAESTHER
jgi:hypothetical protein